MLHDADPAVSAIKALGSCGRQPSYDWLKEQFGNSQVSDAVWRSLDRGRAVLQRVDQLNQYLYSYAPMIAAQWAYAARLISVAPEGRPQRLIDYGCGQGLAGLLLHDEGHRAIFTNLNLIIAIEPSSVALHRAGTIYAALAPQALVRPVNKRFDSVTAEDLVPGAGHTVHLFSNVLDVDGYDHVGLIRKAMQPGRHFIIAVSHDRTSHGYGQGLLAVKSAAESKMLHSQIKKVASRLEQFLCGSRDVPCILWLCELEIGQ